MIRYLVVHGASLTATNALKRTASQLAADLNHVEALEALERVAETPFPPSCPLVHLCLQGLVEVRWSCPLQRRAPRRRWAPQPAGVRVRVRYHNQA